MDQDTEQEVVEQKLEGQVGTVRITENLRTLEKEVAGEEDTQEKQLIRYRSRVLQYDQGQT